jgi:hypothetical protein
MEPSHNSSMSPHSTISQEATSTLFLGHLIAYRHRFTSSDHTPEPPYLWKRPKTNRHHTGKHLTTTPYLLASPHTLLPSIYILPISHAHTFSSGKTTLLDVYSRPEPGALDASAEKALRSSSNPYQHGICLGFGVGWQPEGWVHRTAKQRVCAFIKERVKELEVTVDLISANSTEQRRTRHGATPGTSAPFIHYRSPLFFVLPLVLPSATHTLPLGSKAKCLFTVSDEALFLELFELRPDTRVSTMQKFKRWCLPASSPPRSLSSPRCMCQTGKGYWIGKLPLLLLSITPWSS